MAEEHIPTAPLPEAERLSNGQQRRLLVVIAVAIAGLIALILLLKALLTPRPVPPEVLPPDTFRPTAEQLAGLKFAAVSFGANTELVRATGSIAVDADHSTPILLPYSGQVAKVMVEPGQNVSAGQPLMTIASPELVDARNTLLTAAAQAASAQEAARVAAQNAQRQKAIFETAGGAQKDYLQAQADQIAAQSNLRAAQSALRAAQDRLGLFGKSASEISALESPTRGLDPHATTIYRAPVSGTVADRSVAPGQFISAGGGSPLMTITDLSRVWLVAQLSESDAAKVQLGDEVVVTTPAIPGAQFHARIDNIGAQLDPNTHRLPVRATVDNPGNQLKPQMFASFAIRRQLGGAPGALVPVEAVIHEGDAARVWVMGRDGLLHARPVQTAGSEAGLTRITQGLKPGDKVVTQGALFVNEAGLNQ